MRALLIGAVEGTRVAMETIANTPGWELVGLITLSPDLRARHSDYADLAPDAVRLGCKVMHARRGGDPCIIQEVEALKPDISFVVGWSQLCSEALIQAGGGKLVAYHPAPLPRLRGRAAIPWTILLGEAISASTLFWASAEIDEGPVLAQRFFHLSQDETARSLYAKHMNALRLALQDLLPRLLIGLPAGEPQEEHLATWGARRRPEDGEIQWHEPAISIDRLARAVGRPYPGAFTFAGFDRITVWTTKLAQTVGRFHAMPGQIVASEPGAFAVSCGDGNHIWVVDYESASGKQPKLHAMLGRRSA